MDKLKELLKVLNSIDFALIGGVYYADWVQKDGANKKMTDENFERLINRIYDEYETFTNSVIRELKMMRGMKNDL